MLHTLRTFVYLLLTLLLVALGLAPPAEAATAQVELVAAPDGVLQVREQIQLPAHTDALTRRLPLVTPQGQKVIISQLAVEGGTCRRERAGDVLLLHLAADAGQTVALSYRYDAGADADDAGDHLLFPLIDVIGADLPAVKSGEFSLTLPRGFTLARCRIISGDATSDRNRHVEWEMEQELFSGRLKLPLAAGEAVWLYVELPQGYWIGARSNADTSPQVALVALVGLAGYAVLYRRRINAPEVTAAANSRFGGVAAPWNRPAMPAGLAPCRIRLFARRGDSEIGGAAAPGRSRAAPSGRAAVVMRGTMVGAGATPSGGAVGRWFGRRDRVDPPASLRSAAPFTKGGLGETQNSRLVRRSIAPSDEGAPPSGGEGVTGSKLLSPAMAWERGAADYGGCPPICIHSILLTGHPSPAEFALQPLLWQAHGCIDIREDSCGAIVLQQLQPLPADATAAEKLLWARLFAAKQGDTAHLSFAAAELHPLLDTCTRRTLAAYTAPPLLLRSPRRLCAALPAVALLAAQLLACYRLRLRLVTTLALIAAAAALLLLFLLLLTRLLRRGSPAVSDAYLILPPLLLMGLISAAARYSGASLPHALFTVTAALMQTALAARLVMPTSRRREAAKAAIAAQQNILIRYLQEKPPAVAKDISCYLQLLPLAMSIGRAEEWTQLFAAPPGSSISPRILLHRAHCLYQALLPAFSAAASPLPQRRAG